MTGMIVGTAAYMSPEQARGRTADQRSDVFAFGCVLYEMLTGRQAFQGEDVSDILASVIKVHVDFSQLPSVLNPRVVELLRRCMAKDRKERWYAVGDIRVEIASILTEPQGLPTVAPAVKSPLWKRAVVPILAAVFGATAVLAAMWITRAVPQAGHVVRYTYALSKDEDFTRIGRRVLASSHDGTKLVYVANGQLYLKSIGEVQAKPIPGSNLDPTNPMFSPDGQWIAFYSAAERKLKKIPLGGGASVTLAETLDNPFGASWALNDQILIGQGVKGIVRVPGGGGKPETLIAPVLTEVVDGPELLPGGQELMFTVVAVSAGAPDSRWNRSQIVVQNIQSGTRKVVIQVGSEAHYVSTGHLIYAIGTTIYGVPFDLKKLQTIGGPVPVLEGVRRSSGAQTGAAFLSLSDDGSLFSIPGGVNSEAPRMLVLVDRSGSKKTLPVPAAGYDAPRISRDGKHLAVGITDSKESNIWIYDLDQTTSIRRLTFGGDNQVPAWTPDSKRIAFRSDRNGEGIYWQAADGSGSAERLTTIDKDSAYDAPLEWSPDGKTLLFYVARGDGGGGVWTLAMDGDRKRQPLFNSASTNMRRPSLSSDGRWIAYSSNEEGADFSVYVQPFPPTGAKYKISARTGADSPLWTPDGKQIVFAAGRRLMLVDVQTTPSLTFTEPKALPIEIENTQGRPYDITRDGKQFLVMQRPEQSAAPERTAPQINVVLNWFRELQERVPVK
jgi:eukaryotic-like serine/threonine-protein kinase